MRYFHDKEKTKEERKKIPFWGIWFLLLSLLCNFFFFFFFFLIEKRGFVWIVSVFKGILRGNFSGWNENERSNDLEYVEFSCFLFFSLEILSLSRTFDKFGNFEFIFGNNFPLRRQKILAIFSSLFKYHHYYKFSLGKYSFLYLEAIMTSTDKY